MDHDRLFKELLIAFFCEFLELFFPELAANLEPKSVEFLDKELFTDVAQGDRHEADLVVRARFRAQALCFLLHVETQAQPQADFARRMFGYFALLYICGLQWNRSSSSNRSYSRFNRRRRRR